MLRQELTNITPVVLEIITVVVGQNVKSVVGAIQEQEQSMSALNDPSNAHIKDLTLILSILKTVGRLTRVPEFVSEASERLISTGMIQSCLLLYSWSHTLVRPEFDNEPVYGDIALQYLDCMSSFPPLAEEMGIEGLLSRILGSRLTYQLQNMPDGAGHLDKRPQSAFLYRVWATHLLPISLNLLHSIGGPIAAEVSVFLNQFPRQLDRASTAFIQATQSKSRQPSLITLNVSREASNLALLSFILESYRSAGASAAVDPSTILPLRGYDEHRGALAEDISDVLSAGTAALTTRLTATNEEEIELTRAVAKDSNLLAVKVLQELKSTLQCLKGQDFSDNT